MKKVLVGLVLAISLTGMFISAEASESNLTTGTALAAVAGTVPAVAQHGRRRRMRRRMRRHMRRMRRARRHMRRHGHM